METCIICLDEIKDDIKFLRCAHKFHTNCINTWLREKLNCPICKTPISTNAPTEVQYTSPTNVIDSSMITAFIFDNIEQKLPASPYIKFLNVLTRSFTRSMLRNNYRTIPPQIEPPQIEPPQIEPPQIVSFRRTSRSLLEKAISLEKKLLDNGVNLSELPLEQLDISTSREIVGFLYMRLLEYRDLNVLHNS